MKPPSLSPSARRLVSSRGALWVMIPLLFLVVAVGRAGANAEIRVAVAPFAGGQDGAQMSDALSARLAQRAIERLIAPDAFTALPEHEPTAARVRQWAYTTAVDTVIVGRVFDGGGARGRGSLVEGDPERSFEVEAVLRSGHSGAEIGRHRVSVARRGELDAAADRLAAAILGDLGYLATTGVDAAPHRDPRTPEPPLLGPPSDPADPEAGADFELGRLRDDQPIEINAEEAEIVDRGEDRRLVFQRNVRVRQGDVRLESDQLEAEYRKGETEPDRLIAIGSVRVDQGYRRARCDRAVYLRVEQTLSCEGRAELVQGCDVVRGNAIEFDLAGDEAHVVGAASIVIRPAPDETQSCRTIETAEGTL